MFRKIVLLISLFVFVLPAHSFASPASAVLKEALEMAVQKKSKYQFKIVNSAETGTEQAYKKMYDHQGDLARASVKRLDDYFAQISDEIDVALNQATPANIPNRPHWLKVTIGVEAYLTSADVIAFIFSYFASIIPYYIPIPPVDPSVFVADPLIIYPTTGIHEVDGYVVSYDPLYIPAGGMHVFNIYKNGELIHQPFYYGSDANNYSDFGFRVEPSINFYPHNKIYLDTNFVNPENLHPSLKQSTIFGTEPINKREILGRYYDLSTNGYNYAPDVVPDELVYLEQAPFTVPSGSATVDIFIPDPVYYPNWQKELVDYYNDLQNYNPADPAANPQPVEVPIPIPQQTSVFPNPLPYPTIIPGPVTQPLPLPVPPIIPPPIGTKVDPNACGCKVPYTLGKPWLFAVPFMMLIGAVATYILHLITFLLTIPLIPSVPLDNSGFNIVRTFKIGNIPIYDTVLTLIGLYLSLSIFKVIRRIFSG